MSKTDITKTHKIIASLRIHVVSTIGCVKQYVLSNVIPLSIVPYVNHIWYICCALSLFHPPLVVDVDKLSDADLARIKCIVAAELNHNYFLLNLLICCTLYMKLFM